MKIVIVSYSFPPILNVGGMRTYSWAKHFYNQGHEVQIITSKAQNNDVSKFTMNITESFSILEFEDVLYKPKLKHKHAQVDIPQKESNKGKILRFLKEQIPVLDYHFLWEKEVIKYINTNSEMFKNLDVIITSSAPLRTQKIGHRLKKLNKNAVWVLDIRDIKEQQTLKPKLGTIREKNIDYFSNKYIEKADIVTTVSTGLAEELTKKYKPNKEVEVIYNGYFKDNYIDKNKKSKKWSILYTGTFHEKLFDIKPIFKALRLLDIEIPQIEFYGLNEGARHKILMSADADIKKHLHFHDALSNELIAIKQMESAILLLIDNPNSKGVLLTKSFEYLAAEGHIIALINNNSELNRTIYSKFKFVNVTYEEKEIAKFINMVYVNRNIKLSSSEVKNIEFYSRESQAERLSKLIKNCKKEEWNG